MHVRRSLYYDTPVLLDAIVGGWSSGDAFDDDGQPLTAEGRCLKAAILAHPGEKTYPYGSMRAKEGVFWRFLRDGKPVSEAFAQDAQRRFWNTLEARARAEAWAGLGLAPNAAVVPGSLLLDVHPDDLYLCPGVALEPVRPTAFAMRLAVWASCKAGGLGQVDHGTGTTASRLVHCPEDVQPLLFELARRSDLSPGQTLSNTFRAYAFRVRLGAAPRPRHLPAGYVVDPPLVPGPPRVKGPALRRDQTRRKDAERERRGLAGILPPDEQIAFDRERGLGYWSAS